MPSEDGQLTETCKSNKYVQIESHWTVLTIIILQFGLIVSRTKMNKVFKSNFRILSILLRFFNVMPFENCNKFGLTV
jgi:hypothetical protein